MEGMKDSGTSHLGKIPVEWNVRPFKYCVNICNGREYADIEVEEGGYPVIGSGGEFARASKFCYQGESVLLGRKGTIDKPMYINDAFWCVDTMFYTQIKPNMCARFLYYCALNFRFDYYMTSTALPSMTQSDLGAEKICVPEKSEQQAIADFLDDKCSQIDGIIADIEKQIEILKSYKKSLITETVTKGLDKNVKMKDSGVEWIGQIPEHWKIRKLKYIMSVNSGEAIQAEMLDEGDKPVYGGGKCLGTYPIYNVPEKTLLIGRVGANCGCITLTEKSAWATDNALIVSTNENELYLYYLLSVTDLRRDSDASAQPLVTGGKIGNIKIAFIEDKEEQSKIAYFLGDKCDQIDSIITTKQTQLTKMQQHKKSLIYEYVTGKKRVAI